jgi:hypothetical protein
LGAARFGEALILLPLLIKSLRTEMAVPVLTISQLIGSLLCVFLEFKDIKWKPVIIFINKKEMIIMWKAMIRLLPPILYLGSTIYTYFMIRLYTFRKRYDKAIEISNSKLKENLTDSGVYQYIENINRLPQNSNKQVHSDKIREIYIIVCDNKNISEDLKAQLRVVLKLKGINMD